MVCSLFIRKDVGDCLNEAGIGTGTYILDRVVCVIDRRDPAGSRYVYGEGMHSPVPLPNIQFKFMQIPSLFFLGYFTLKAHGTRVWAF